MRVYSSSVFAGNIYGLHSQPFSVQRRTYSSRTILPGVRVFVQPLRRVSWFCAAQSQLAPLVTFRVGKLKAVLSRWCKRQNTSALPTHLQAPVMLNPLHRELAPSACTRAVCVTPAVPTTRRQYVGSNVCRTASGRTRLTKTHFWKSSNRSRHSSLFSGLASP